VRETISFFEGMKEDPVMKRFIVCAIAMALISAPAMALIPNFEGFENPAWAPDTSGSTTRTTWGCGTRIVSGADGLTSFNGAAHYRLDSGSAALLKRTYHGGVITDPLGPGWTLSYAVYIDIDSDFAPDTAVKGFGIEQSTLRNNGYMQSHLVIAVNGDTAQSETWTRMFVDNQGWSAGSARYLARTRTDAWDIPASGWYNIVVDFVKGQMDADPAEENLSYAKVYSPAGVLLHSFGKRGGWLEDPGMQTHSSMSLNGLAGPSTLALDDTQTMWIPEPASLSLLALGGLMLLRRRR
jgi:hypothetical protein